MYDVCEIERDERKRTLKNERIELRQVKETFETSIQTSFKESFMN